MGIQGLIRLLLPKEHHFYTFLERQAAVALDGARALASFKDARTAASVRDDVQGFEHAGDKIVREMEDALARTFVTPIDREDLQSLSSNLDDILDLTNGAARAAALYGVERPTVAMANLMDVLVRCTDAIAATMPNLRKNAYADVIHAAHAIRQLEKEGDAVFREAVRVLFNDPGVDTKVLLREKEVLEHLEAAINHCERVADRLTNLAVKHG